MRVLHFSECHTLCECCYEHSTDRTPLTHYAQPHRAGGKAQSLISPRLTAPHLTSPHLTSPHLTVQVGEYYTSGVIANMIEQGALFKGLQIDPKLMYVLGTPTQARARVCAPSRSGLLGTRCHEMSRDFARALCCSCLTAHQL